MNWTDEILKSIDPVVTQQGYQFAAGVLTKKLGESIHAEQLRSARRRWLGRALASDTMTLKEEYEYEWPLAASNGVKEFEFSEDDNNTQNDLGGSKLNDSRFNLPLALEPIQQEIISIDDQNILVLADCHCPFHDVKMIERALTITRQFFPHVKKVAIIGDLIDFSSISRWAQDGPSRTTAEQDVRVAGSLIDELLKHFNDLYLCSGNHDERLSARLNSHYSLETILCGGIGNKNPHLHITDLDYLMVGDDTIIGHSSIYSRRATASPNKAAMLLKYNIAVGHSHKIGLVVSDDGIHWAADVGHCANVANFYYIRRRINTFSKSAGGFMVLSNGKPQMFGESISDWKFWGV